MSYSESLGQNERILKMIFLLILIWLSFGLIGQWLLYRGENNEFGWSQRALKLKQIRINSLFNRFIHIIFGPLAIPITILVYGKYCFMSKRKSLNLYDQKDIITWGYRIGYRIAKKEGRIKEINGSG